VTISGNPRHADIKPGLGMGDNTAGDAAPLRILIVSAYALPHLGGVEVVVARQAATLAALGHQVTVMTSRYEAGASGTDGQAQQSRTGQVGYRVIQVPAWNGLERRWGIAVPVYRPWQLLRQLIRLSRDADVIHVHDAYHASSVLAACLARLLRKPLFATQHVGMVEHDMAAVRLAQWIVYAAAGRLVWRWASAVTAYNPIVQNFLLEWHVPAAKIRLSYIGIDIREFCPGDAESAQATRKRYGLPGEIPIVFHAGRLVPKKGCGKLLAASGPEYQVVIAGPGRIPSQVPPHVTFLGPVDRDDLRDLYQASDIFAFPATGEMLTLVMQEAMACGLPVVATADPGYSSYDLDPSGIALVEPEPAELRAEFLDILGNPERRQRMQVYSRQLAVERFDWQRNPTDLAAEYTRACPPPGRPGRVRWCWRVLAGAAGLAAAISLLVPAGRHQWALSLLRQPTHYTVLFFDRAAVSPARITAGQPVHIGFTVGNHEGRTMRYRYVISSYPAGGGRRPRLLAESAKLVPLGSSWSVSATVRPRCGSVPCRIQVSLPGHPETIDFLLTPAGPGE
jgi:glycosyltransferase involved in cell wall biosynthesis